MGQPPGLRLRARRRQRDALGTPGGILDTPSLGGSSGSGVTPGSSVPGTPRNGYYGGVDPVQLAAAAFFADATS